ncbi:TRAP transporter large permease [Ferrovibrio sp.]|uniref:TRAP transporter large permease n=1 Tax=Ferrovibrio sp. TaxID=1917215 RepID=UPI0025C41005|nr:TRAP transporter large permease [Ferrovibrio sp.]
MELPVYVPMILFLVLLALGMPIGLALGVTGALGVATTFGFDAMLGVLQTTPFRTSASALLSTIPLFILMAELLARGSVVRDVFRLAYTCMGHLKGGLALAAVMANVGFAALAGSSTAAAAAMSKISVPEMRRYGYDDRLSLGTVAVAGTLAIMIPPSLGFILYGILTENSIGKLFLAGIIPGIITAIAYCATIYVWVSRNPGIAPKVQPFPMAERFAAMKPVWPAGILIFIVIGGIYSGAITATEAAAVGAGGALIISVIWGGLRWTGITESLQATTRATAMIFTIIIGAMIFGYFMAATQVPQHLVEWVGELPLPRWGILLIIVVIYLILGFFMDQIAIVVLTLPLTYPLILSLGYDPIWFGVIIVKTTEIGLVTPPMGLNVFVAAGSVGARIETGFKGIMPFLIAEAIVLAMLIVIPELSLWIPNNLD